MSAMAATEDARACNSLPATRPGVADRRRAEAGAALVVLFTTGAKTYGVAIRLVFPWPSVAVGVEAVPGGDLAPGRHL
jgi:hypothetical protein